MAAIRAGEKRFIPQVFMKIGHIPTANSKNICKRRSGDVLNEPSSEAFELLLFFQSAV